MIEATGKTLHFSRKAEVEIKPTKSEVQLTLYSLMLDTQKEIMKALGLVNFEARYTFHLHAPTHTGKRFASVSAYVNPLGEYE